MLLWEPDFTLSFTFRGIRLPQKENDTHSKQGAGYLLQILRRVASAPQKAVGGFIMPDAVLIGQGRGKALTGKVRGFLDNGRQLRVKCYSG